ncbi:hypothetical protein [Nocardiopsis trehalosi]|jgi:hypothetical protein|uniref:hypothetical protein n=1 Tax=Nocardiopsis trehalosi TaxID=109329 RepID=UPI00082E2AA2|nr:hypothetical protein [Nocardiopsis trehalosi]
MRVWTTGAAGAAVLVLALTGCGDGGGDPPAPTPSSTIGMEPGMPPDPSPTESGALTHRLAEGTRGPFGDSGLTASVYGITADGAEVHFEGDGLDTVVVSGPVGHTQPVGDYEATVDAISADEHPYTVTLTLRPAGS